MALGLVCAGLRLVLYMQNVYSIFVRCGRYSFIEMDLFNGGKKH
jgi:hypothetical protein